MTVLPALPSLHRSAGESAAGSVRGEPPALPSSLVVAVAQRADLISRKSVHIHC
jgi:hypothetical protein